MTTKADFTPEEWMTVLRSLPNAATYVITADLSIFGALREMRAFAKAMRQTEAPPAAQELVGSIVADLEEKERTGGEVPTTETGEDIRGDLRQTLVEAAAVIDAQCSPDEAAGFKTWLLSLAEVTAKAQKEGGFLGIGGVRVSDREQEALQEIASALGVS